MPSKTASTPNIDLRCFVARQFFVANLRTFLVYNLQAKKCGGIQKMTNIRYAQLLHADHKWGLHHWILLPCNRKSSAAIQKVLGQRFTLSLSLFIDCLMGGQVEQVKGNLIDQVHRKCSTSKWMMNVDFSVLSWECIIHFNSFAFFFGNISSDWSHLLWLKVTRVSKLCCLSLSSVLFFLSFFHVFSSSHQYTDTNGGKDN